MKFATKGSTRSIISGWLYWLCWRSFLSLAVRKSKQPLPETSQTTFASPAEAGLALQSAVKAKDAKAISHILGSKA